MKINRQIRSMGLSTLVASLLLATLTVFARAQSQLEPPESIPFLSPAQMPAEDAQLAAQSQQAVTRSAQIYGFVLDSSYTYREIACPVIPHTLLLAYESVSPNGAISRFTAVLGRDGNIRRTPVQIIPILHFGVVPFVPAFSSPHSIEVFNQAVPAAPMGRTLLSGMQTGQQPLLLRGLCYLAMVGAEPAALNSPSLDAATVHAPVPTLQFVEKGKARQLISIRSSASTYQLWTLSFSPDGRLTSAARNDHPVEPATPAALQTTLPAAPASSPITAGLGTVSATPLPQPAPASPPAMAASSPPSEKPTEPPPAPRPAPPQTAVTTTAATTAATPKPVQIPPAVVAALPIVHKDIPDPPHRFIPNPPAPPGRTIPASALPTPPHQNQ